MKTRNLSRVASLLMVAAMVGGSLFAAPPSLKPCASAVQSQDWSFPAEASQLLKEIQSTATQLTRDTATLESYTLSGLSRQSHANQLTSAKEHINAIGERLQAIQHAVAPWQRQAVDAIVPVAAHLASRTEAAIQHLNENRNHLWAPAYTDHLKTIADRANQVKTSIDLHLELASTQDKLEELRLKVATIGS